MRRRVSDRGLQMRIAIISDIHGNKEALEQVWADIKYNQADDIISLGDHIGYGPDPEHVIQTIRRQKFTTILGNHELALNEPSYLDWFNQAARRSLRITQKRLSAQSVNFIAGLNTHCIRHGCRFVHGFPPDSALTYLYQLTDKTKLRALKNLSEKRCFIGHTHTLDMVSYGPDGFESGRLHKGTNKLDAGRKYIISAGSVGQPRDGNNNAKYLIWNSIEDSVEVKYVAYDIAAVVEKMMAAGLPQAHARRLW